MVDKNLLNSVLRMAKSQKEAYAPPVPPPGGDPSQMGAMPPAPGGMLPPGGMPMDPSQMGAMPAPGGMPPAPGGMPMDPSQMGMPPPGGMSPVGGMPMDPSQMAPPDPSAGGAVPIMMSTEDLMGLIQMAAQGGQGGDGGAGQASQEGGEEAGPGETGRFTNKKLVAALEERISGLEDMLAQMMNAMGIQVQEQPVAGGMGAGGGTPPGVVGGMGEGAPSPIGMGGMPPPMPPPEMGPVGMGKMASGAPLSEALRKMRLINSYRE